MLTHHLFFACNIEANRLCCFCRKVRLEIQRQLLLEFAAFLFPPDFRPRRKAPCHQKDVGLHNFGALVSPFRINTYKSVSKQSTLTTFRINTYKKRGEGGMWSAAVLLPLLRSPVSPNLSHRAQHVAQARLLGL